MQRGTAQHSAALLTNANNDASVDAQRSAKHASTHLGGCQSLQCQWAGQACQAGHLGQCMLGGAAVVADWVGAERVEGLEEMGAQGMAEMAAAGCAHIEM